MDNVISFVTTYAPKSVPYILVLSIFIDIIPIKFSPWKWLLKKIGGVMLAETNSRIDGIEKKVDSIQVESENNRVEYIRWNILDFANSCRNGRTHTRSEWEHVMSQMDDYNAYIAERKIKNGVLDAEEKYLNQIFHDRLAKNDFL